MFIFVSVQTLIDYRVNEKILKYIIEINNSETRFTTEECDVFLNILYIMVMMTIVTAYVCYFVGSTCDNNIIFEYFHYFLFIMIYLSWSMIDYNVVVEFLVLIFCKAMSLINMCVPISSVKASDTIDNYIVYKLKKHFYLMCCYACLSSIDNFTLESCVVIMWTFKYLYSITEYFTTKIKSKRERAKKKSETIIELTNTESPTPYNSTNTTCHLNDNDNSDYDESRHQDTKVFTVDSCRYLVKVDVHNNHDALLQDPIQQVENEIIRPTPPSHLPLAIQIYNTDSLSDIQVVVPEPIEENSLYNHLLLYILAILFVVSISYEFLYDLKLYAATFSEIMFTNMWIYCQNFILFHVVCVFEIGLLHYIRNHVMYDILIGKYNCAFSLVLCICCLIHLLMLKLELSVFSWVHISMTAQIVVAPILILNQIYNNSLFSHYDPRHKIAFILLRDLGHTLCVIVSILIKLFVLEYFNIYDILFYYDYTLVIMLILVIICAKLL